MTIKTGDDLILALHLRKLYLKHKQYDKAADLLSDILQYVADDVKVEGERVKDV